MRNGKRPVWPEGVLARDEGPEPDHVGPADFMRSSSSKKEFGIWKCSKRQIWRRGGRAMDTGLEGRSAYPLICSISRVPPIPQCPPGPRGHGAPGLGPVVTHGPRSGTERPGQDLPFSPHRLPSLCPSLPFSCLGGFRHKSMPDSSN